MLAAYPITRFTVTLLPGDMVSGEVLAREGGRILSAIRAFGITTRVIPQGVAGKYEIEGFLTQSRQENSLIGEVDRLNSGSSGVVATLGFTPKVDYEKFLVGLRAWIARRLPPSRCKKDVKQCPDGSHVTRQGRDCQFPPCPQPSGYDYGIGTLGTEWVIESVR